jgi:hypothetical protein
MGVTIYVFADINTDTYFDKIISLTWQAEITSSDNKTTLLLLHRPILSECFIDITYDMLEELSVSQG